MPALYIIAGPNGVGKMTFADRYLPDEAKQLEFVNADLIAPDCLLTTPIRSQSRPVESL